MSKSFFIILLFAPIYSHGGSPSCQDPEVNIATSSAIALSDKNVPRVAAITYGSAHKLSGSVEIDGTITGSTSSKSFEKVFLYETEGRDFFLLDSADASAGSFHFDLENAETGVYKLGFGPATNYLIDIIVNFEESPLDLRFRNNVGQYSLIASSGTENRALAEYTTLARNHKSDIRLLQRSTLSQGDKTHKIYERDAQLKQAQDSLAAAYPNTFFANMAAHLQSPYRFEKNNYWNDLNFQDVSLIHSEVFPDRIEDFMRIHASKEKSDSNAQIGFYNAVDMVANKIKSTGSDDVLEFVLYTLSEGFYSSGMEQLSLYVIDNYFYGDACGDAEISELFKMKASGIRNLQIGSVSPDFSLAAVSGDVIDLNKVAGENTYTLVLFWASFCHICEREIPQLIKLYRAYYPHGFQILAVSVDAEKRKWLEAVKSQSMEEWYNVSELDGWRGSVAKSYRVTSTPKMFLINNGREIVAKPKNVTELSNFLHSVDSKLHGR